jgi:hypothetical protein
LQDYSTRPTTNTDVGGDVAGFRSNVQSFSVLTTNYNSHANVLLYCTWGRPDLVAVGTFPSIQSMQGQLTTNYSNAASDFNLFGFAPVGDAFMATVASGLSINPTNGLETPGPGQISLWQSDIYHASTYGSYLDALVFYAKILGADPRALPTGPGSAASDLGLDPTACVQLQNIAYLMVLGSNSPGDFSFAADPSSQVVTIGSNALFAATVVATNGFTGDVAISVTGLPANVSANVSPSTVSNSGTSTLTLTISTNAPPGTYPLTVAGTHSNTTHTAMVTLTINVPDFLFAVDTNTQVVTIGSNAVFTASVIATNGFTGDVELSVTGLPVNVGVAFSPTSVNTSGTATLTLTTSTNTPPGTYPLTITGTSSTTSHTAVVTLTIDGVIPSWWLQQYFGTNTTNSSSCAICDADGTGQNNLFKYIAGLDPTNPASVFILNIVNTNNTPNLIFSPIVAGRIYTPQFSTNLVFGGWIPLASYTGPETNVDQATITDTNAVEPQRYYRISISLP